MAKLINYIFPERDEFNTFIVIDGAATSALLDQLYEDDSLEFCCLFEGELDAGVAEMAPYLVRLDKDHRFTKWVLSGWGDAWGLYLHVPKEVEFAALKRHLRKLIAVRGLDGRPNLFRYYDPRILRVVLPSYDEKQLKMLFGPVQRIMFEANLPEKLACYSLYEHQLVQQNLILIK